jgi:hypothetical protein
MTEQEIQAVEEWATARTAEGLILDQTDSGEANGSILRAFISNNRLPYTPESLSTAVRMAKGLIWAAGHEPAAAAAVAADEKAARRRASGIDSFGAGGNERTNTHTVVAADQLARHKANVARQAEEDARATAAANARLRYQEENQKIFYAGDRLNMPATEAAQKSAREKWAKLEGRTLAPTVIREIPDDHELTTKEMHAFTKEELARYIAKQKRGRGY